MILKRNLSTTLKSIIQHVQCAETNFPSTLTEKYLYHYHTDHPQEEANEPEPDTEMITESEDELTDEENPRAELIREDKQFHKDINCITIDQFLDIKELISNNHFESLVENNELSIDEGLADIVERNCQGIYSNMFLTEISIDQADEGPHVWLYQASECQKDFKRQDKL